MNQSFTAVIDRNVDIVAGQYETEPYEVAWAKEARWFVRVLDVQGRNAMLSLHPQISPDGLFWCDEGTEPLRISGKGLYSFPLREFGHWLRLRGVASGEQVAFKVIVYLALKE